MSTYIFGYGSLIATKKKKYPVVVTGLKRSFNVSVNKYKNRALGVKHATNSVCNGVLFKVYSKELEALIIREGNYIPKLLSPEQLDFKLKTNDRVIFFQPMPKYILTKKQMDTIPITPGYLEICLSAASKISKEFAQDFIGTTYGL